MNCISVETCQGSAESFLHHLGGGWGLIRLSQQAITNKSPENCFQPYFHISKVKIFITLGPHLQPPVL